MEIGIIGAESKHTEFFGALLNRQSLFADMSVGSIWGGDCPGRIGWCMDQGGIPVACTRAEEVVERSDGVLITLRRGDAHRPPALACLRAGKPVFVDKPFACTVEEAEEMVAVSRETGTPLMGGSTLCFLPQIEEFRERARHCTGLTISYSADCDSPYGGWPYYGSHLTDLCSVICGLGARMVSARRIGDAVDVLVRYPERRVLLHSEPQLKEPVLTFQSWDEERCPLPDFDRCYEYGMRAFRDMMHSHLSRGTDRLVFSTRLLAAIERSLREEREVAVA